jgi:transcriptional regulator with PAS, ATPase and Fis domain
VDSTKDFSMNVDIPAPVANKLNALCVDARHPGYVCVKNDRAVQFGGDLARYGIKTIDGEKPIGDQIDYLESLLPLNGESLEIPCLQTKEDLYADLFLFPGEEGDYVLFMDATQHAHRMFDYQQNTNELTLLRRQQMHLISEIEQNRNHLLTVLNQLRLVTTIINELGQIDFLSESGARFFGLDPKGVVGKHWRQALPIKGDDIQRLEALLHQAPDTRERLQVHAEANHGRTFAFDVDVQDDPHHPDKRIIYMYDVSEIFNLRQLLSEKSSFHDILGQSRSMMQVFETIRDIAKVDATVLIQGETGTGKELVASALHYESHRRDNPFIVVNSAGLSDSLINSQLFGHTKGAFTDAVADQVGFFEAAAGGTILLDEIGDIPLNTQTRILRALEQKEIIRIGETKPRQIDVRILAATHKDLDAEVKNGNFRLDLLYRIRVARVQLPALRERSEDIPWLVQSFIEKTRASTGKGVENIDEGAMRALMDYEWPGNVRELKNAISYAAIHCKETHIRLTDLPPEIRTSLAGGDTPKRATQHSVEDEKERILKALEMSGGQRGEAAKLLGIGRATLYRRMKECMIDPASLPKRANWK